MSFPVTDRDQLKRNRDAVVDQIHTTAEKVAAEIQAKADAKIRKYWAGAVEKVERYRRDWAEEDKGAISES